MQLNLEPEQNETDRSAEQLEKQPSPRKVTDEGMMIALRASQKLKPWLSIEINLDSGPNVTEQIEKQNEKQASPIFSIASGNRTSDSLPR
jgi:hypothetical protein